VKRSFEKRLSKLQVKFPFEIGLDDLGVTPRYNHRKIKFFLDYRKENKMAKKREVVGDWIRTTQPGFWRISRIQKVVSRDPVNGKPFERTLVFANRISSDSLRESFATTVCDASMTRPLTKNQISKIEKKTQLLE